MGGAAIVVACIAATLVFDTPLTRGLHEWGILPDSVPVMGAAGHVPTIATSQPATVDVEFPVSGSTPLVTHLAAGMIAGTERIDVSFWTDGPEGDAVVDDAMAEALTQNAYVFVDAWETEYLGDRAVAVYPAYVYEGDEYVARQDATAVAVARALTDLDLDQLAAEDQVSAIHAYVAAAATYDLAASEAIDAGGATAADRAIAQSQEAYGILVAGTAVCNGYAQAFKAIADAAGLSAVTVTGEVVDESGRGLHAWNRVLVDGEWLVVDVTWDDTDDPKPVTIDYLLLDQSDPALDSRTADRDWMIDARIADYSSS